MALKEGTWQWWLDLPSELRDQWLESLRAMMALDGATPETVTDVPASLVPKLLSLDSMSEAQMQNELKLRGFIHQPASGAWVTPFGKVLSDGSKHALRLARWTGTGDEDVRNSPAPNHPYAAAYAWAMERCEDLRGTIPDAPILTQENIREDDAAPPESEIPEAVVDAGDEGTPEAVTDAGSTLAPFHFPCDNVVFRLSGIHFPCDNVVFRLSGTVKQSHLAPDNATIIDEIDIDSLCAVKPEDDAAPPPKRDTTGAWQALCEQLCQLAEWATLLAEEDDVRECSPAVGNFWQNRSKRDVCAIGLRFLGVNLALPVVDLPEPFPVATEGVNGREIEVETPVVKMPPPERTDGLRIKLRCPGCGVPWVFSLVEPLEHECKNCHRIFAPPAHTGRLP
jgi:hypothetical protein